MCSGTGQGTWEGTAWENFTQPAASAEDTLGIDKARLIEEGKGQALKAGHGPSVG